MATNKTRTVKLSNSLRNAMVIFLLLWLLLFFLQTDSLANPVASVLGTTPERVKSVAASVLPAVLALGVITLAVVFAGVPVLGVVLAVVAVVSVIATLWSYFSGPGPSLGSESLNRKG